MTLEELKDLFTPQPTPKTQLMVIPPGSHTLKLIENGKVKRTYFAKDGHLGAVTEDC